MRQGGTAYRLCVYRNAAKRLVSVMRITKPRDLSRRLSPHASCRAHDPPDSGNGVLLGNLRVDLAQCSDGMLDLLGATEARRSNICGKR